MLLSHQEISILLCPYMEFVSLSSTHALTGIRQHYRLSMNMHACLLYEKCNVDLVGKLPSNITVGSDFKSFLFLIVNYVSISLHRRGGRGARD